MSTLLIIFAVFTYLVAAVLLIGGGILKSPAILNAMKLRYAKRDINDKQAAKACIPTGLLLAAFGTVVLVMKGILGV